MQKEQECNGLCVWTLYGQERPTIPDPNCPKHGLPPQPTGNDLYIIVELRRAGSDIPLGKRAFHLLVGEFHWLFASGVIYSNDQMLSGIEGKIKWYD